MVKSEFIVKSYAIAAQAGRGYTQHDGERR